jgi:hypothetical protein
MTLSDGTDEIKLEFGQNSSHEDLNQQAPPAPPEDSFYGYFQRNSRNYWTDYRGISQKQVNWRLVILPGDQNNVQISWNVESTKIRGPLTLTNTNTGQEKDMLSQQEISISQETTYSIDYALEE